MLKFKTRKDTLVDYKMWRIHERQKNREKAESHKKDATGQDIKQKQLTPPHTQKKKMGKKGKGGKAKNVSHS